MRVGVYLDEVPPETGGGFTFSHTVITAFLQAAGGSRHDYVLFCPKDYAARLQGDVVPPNVKVCGMHQRSRLEKVVANLRHYFPLTGLLFKGPGRLERMARSEGVEVMWFAGGFHDTIDIPYISTVWDLQHRTHPGFPEFSANWLWDHRDLYYGRHIRRASRVIVGTSVGQQQVENFYGVYPLNVRLLPHPTPEFALDASRDGRVRARTLIEPYLVYPAQFWAHKNHVNLLVAWRLLVDQDAAAPLLAFVGSDKGNKSFIEQKAKELGIEHKVRFLGFVPTDDLVGLYQNAVALVYPSFSGPENLPPLEAFALGCPVVASEFPGAREQLGDAVVYFSPHSPPDMASAVASICNNAALREQLISRGRTVAATRTSTSFVGGVFSILDEFEAERRAWPS